MLQRRTVREGPLFESAQRRRSDKGLAPRGRVEPDDLHLPHEGDPLQMLAGAERLGLDDLYAHGNDDLLYSATHEANAANVLEAVSQQHSLEIPALVEDLISQALHVLRGPEVHEQQIFASLEGGKADALDARGDSQSSDASCHEAVSLQRLQPIVQPDRL